MKDDQIRQLVIEGKTNYQIAELLHVGRETLRLWRIKNGFPSNKKIVPKQSLSNLQNIVQRVNAGITTITNEANVLNMSRITLAKQIKEVGLKYREYRPRHPEWADYYQLTQIQKEMLTGDLFGDGGLSKTSIGKAYYQTAHAIKQEMFLNWKFEVMKPLSSRKYSYETDDGIYVTMGTWTSPALYEFFKKFYPTGKKVLLDSLVEDMSALSLAVWYMGDGSVNRYTSVFNVGLQVDLPPIANAVSNKFGLEFKACRYEKQWHLRVMEADKFYNIISPYMLENFKYKIPSTYHYLINNQHPSLIGNDKEGSETR